MEEIIKVENLCFEYEPGLQTINNISFQIHKGEYVAILGHKFSTLIISSIVFSSWTCLVHSIIYKETSQIKKDWISSVNIII